MRDPMSSSPASERLDMLLLSYAWIAACGVPLPFIALQLSADPDDAEQDSARWHARHGLLIAGLFSLGSVALLGVGAGLLGMIAVGVRAFFLISWGLFWIGSVALCAVCFVKAVDGERWVWAPLQRLLNKQLAPQGQTLATPGEGAAED